MAASPAADSLTLADVKWWELYADTTLQNFIKQALEYNKDMLIAAERIRELECRYRIQRSELWPSISAEAYASNEYNNYGGNAADPNDPELGPKISLRWEIDIWGHLRWASREKMAEYLASIEAQRALQMTLVSEVAKTYFELLSLDNELEIVRRTLETRQEGVKQAKLRADGGLTSEIPHQQALVELATTASLVPDLERKVAVKESELAFLTGTYPHEMKRPRQVLELSYRDILPTGIPSQLLERRPDLMESWQRLRAAEAAVGVAQAERFPTFVIDLSGGLESNSFLDVLKSPFYYAAAGIASPIFEFGKRKAAFRAAISEYNQAKLEYEKNVMQAVKEVYDAVVTFNSARENTNLKFDLQEASRKYVSLASSQYINGILNYLDVLDAQRSYFDAQVELSNAIANEYIALTELYKALGGGW